MTGLCTPGAQGHRVPESGSAALICPARPDSGGQGGRLGPVLRVGYPRVVGPFNAKDSSDALQRLQYGQDSRCPGGQASGPRRLPKSHPNGARSTQVRRSGPYGRRAGYERRPLAPGSSSSRSDTRVPSRLQQHTPILTPCPVMYGWPVDGSIKGSTWPQAKGGEHRQ